MIIYPTISQSGFTRPTGIRPISSLTQYPIRIFLAYQHAHKHMYTFSTHIHTQDMHTQNHVIYSPPMKLHVLMQHSYRMPPTILLRISLIGSLIRGHTYIKVAYFIHAHFIIFFCNFLRWLWLEMRKFFPYST